MEQLNTSKVFKALSSEQRLKIFMMIYNECCRSVSISSGREKTGKDCCSSKDGMEMAFTKASEMSGISRSTVSHHIKELQNAGLIICERKGRVINCRVNDKAVNLIKHMFG